MAQKKNNPYILLIGTVLLSFLPGFIGNLYTLPKITTWYTTLTKPFFNPPNWIFGPVWTTLYLLIGLSLFLLIRESQTKNISGKKKTILKRAYGFFALHLALNATWSLIFFGAENIFLAFVVIVALVLVIIEMIRDFSAIKPLAGKLLWPYLAWVSFATLLNGAIFLLN